MKAPRTLLKIWLTLLSAMACISAAAQQAQDALYIFRNDGQFNAFFYGDIQRIDYSHVDTLGVEHYDYVVQEVYALDSVFRIPLSAIDSVSFVTPRTQYKSDVVRPDASIADYIVASDSLYWIRLALNTPSQLIPKKGDKLLIEEPSRYIPDGFGGLVTAVTKGSDGYTVTTDALELEDVYDVLVLKSAGVPKDEATARRNAGDADWSYESTEPIELPALTGSVSLLSGQYKMLPDESPVQISLDGSLDISGSLQSDIDLRCFLYFNTLCNQDRYYQIAKFKNTVDISAAITGALTAHADVPFTFVKDLVKKGGKYILKEAGKKLSVNMGTFWADFSFGIYFEGQGTLSSNYTWQNKHSLNTTYQYDRNILWNTWEDFYHYSLFNERDTTTWTFAAGKFALSTGIYGQAEVACNIPFVKKKGSAVLRLDAGLKSEFDVPIFADHAYLPFVNTYNLYKELNFDETVTFSTPGNLSFALNCGHWAWTPKLAFSLTKPVTFGIVPNISNLKWHDEKYEPYNFTIESPVTRNLLLPMKIGFAVFDIDDKQVEDYWYTTYQNDRIIKSYKHLFDTLDPRKDEGTVYTVFPQINYFGHPLLVDQSAEIVIGKARIDIGKKRIDSNHEASHEHITFVPNMKNVELKSNAPWLTFVRVDHEGTLSLFWDDMPGNTNSRKGTVFVTGKNKDGEILVEDSIVVTQSRAYIAIHPQKLTFGINGGTQTVTIDSTNVKQVTVQPTPAYIKTSLNGKTLTVNVSKNDSQAYTYVIVLEGETEAGVKAYAYITVAQDGNNDNPQQGEEIEISHLDIGSIGGYKTLNGGAPKEFNLIGFEEHGNGKTKSAIIYDDHIHVTCNQNYTWYDEETYDVDHGTVNLTISFDIMKSKDAETGNVTIWIENFKYADKEKNVYRYWNAYDCDANIDVELDLSGYKRMFIRDEEDGTYYFGMYGMAIAWASTDDKLVFKNFNWTENTQSYEWKNNEWVPATNGYATNTYQYYQTETHKGYLRNVNIGFPEETWKNWISK